jgi:hypothetical protein
VLGLYTGFFLNNYLGTPQTTHTPGEKNSVLVVAGILILVSVIIQFIGVSYYLYYPDKTMSEERVWNWSDSIIMGSYSYGSGNVTGIYVYTLPPLPPLLQYHFHPVSTGK